MYCRQLLINEIVSSLAEISIFTGKSALHSPRYYANEGLLKWSLLKTIIWIDKTNLRAHDLESLLEKTYEAGTKGRQISYKKEVRGFCDLSLEWNHILSITVKLVLFDINIFVFFGYLIDSRSKFPNYWMKGSLKFL